MNTTKIPFIPICSDSLFTIYNIAGWIVSSIICIVLTVLFYPYLESWFQWAIIRVLSWTKISSKHKLSGKWKNKWYVNSTSFPELNENNSVEIKQFRSRIYANFNAVDNQQKYYNYHVFGRIKNDNIVTGTWRDIQSGNRYYGCFQLSIDINENYMTGYWTGVSNEEKIKSGKWEWFRE